LSSSGYERGHSGFCLSWNRGIAINPQYRPWAKTAKAQNTARVTNTEAWGLDVIAPAEIAEAISRYPPVMQVHCRRPWMSLWWSTLSITKARQLVALRMSGARSDEAFEVA
jgi:hypothetical protein